MSKDELNPEQRQALDLVLNGRNIFITGGAGTGKSFCLSYIVRRLHETNKRVQVTATTGIAAVTIEGVTIHSFTGIGIANESKVELRRQANSKKMQDIWSNVDVLIIDEISMMSPDYWDKMHDVIQVARQDSAPFGGLQIVVVGDFFQLPPVKKQKEVDLTKPTFCFETQVWKDSIQHVVELKRVFRQEDPRFVECLNRIRWGSPNTDDLRLLTSRLNVPVGKDGIQPTVLHALTDEVNRMNQEHLDTLKAPGKQYYMISNFISPSSESSGSLPTKSKISRILFDLKKNVPAEEELTLKVGAQVMLLTNLSITHQLVNGSRGVVVRFTSTSPVYPIVRFANLEVVVRGYMWKHTFRPGVFAYVAQIPLKLAYAYTIHKSQSQSMDFVSLRLDKTIFQEGQAYVALSRVRSVDGLSLSSFDPKCIRSNLKVIQFYNGLNNNSHHRLHQIMSGIASTANDEDTKEEIDANEEEEEEDVHIIEDDEVMDEDIVADEKELLDIVRDWEEEEEDVDVDVDLEE